MSQFGNRVPTAPRADAAQDVWTFEQLAELDRGGVLSIGDASTGRLVGISENRGVAPN